MSELTLNLPKTLYHKLENLAAREGVPLDNYIVYALARQASTAYTIEVMTPEEVTSQRESFNRLLENLGEASEADIDKILDQRELVEPEESLRPETIAKLKALIAKQQAVPL